MRVLLAFFLFFAAQQGHAFEKGFNQAWMKDDYAHQWLDGHYSHAYADRLLEMNKEAGSKIIRMWLFEGWKLTQFELDSRGLPLKIRDDVLNNLRDFLQLAKEKNQKVSLTFLDANIFKHLENGDLKNFWWNLVNRRYGMQERFHQVAVKPIYEMIRKDFMGTVSQIDLVNEVNALLEFNLVERGWAGMPKFLCALREGSPVPVTASVGWWLAENAYFSGFLRNSCLNFFDLHFYNDNGDIPRCEEFRSHARAGVKFQLGEFGQYSKNFDDQLQAEVTRKFLTNAKRCGFKSALAWRLIDQRPGYNPEARFSYRAFGKMRKAYEVFKAQP